MGNKRLEARRSLASLPLKDDEVLQEVSSRERGKTEMEAESLNLNDKLNGGEKGKEDWKSGNFLTGLLALVFSLLRTIHAVFNTLSYRRGGWGPRTGAQFPERQQLRIIL